jgi:hypothetical protein
MIETFFNLLATTPQFPTEIDSGILLSAVWKYKDRRNYLYDWHRQLVGVV